MVQQLSAPSDRFNCVSRAVDISGHHVYRRGCDQQRGPGHSLSSCYEACIRQLDGVHAKTLASALG